MKKNVAVTATVILVMALLSSCASGTGGVTTGNGSTSDTAGMSRPIAPTPNPDATKAVYPTSAPQEPYDMSQVRESPPPNPLPSFSQEALLNIAAAAATSTYPALNYQEIMAAEIGVSSYTSTLGFLMTDETKALVTETLLLLPLFDMTQPGACSMLRNQILHSGAGELVDGRVVLNMGPGVNGLQVPFAGRFWNLATLVALMSGACGSLGYGVHIQGSKVTITMPGQKLPEGDKVLTAAVIIIAVAAVAIAVIWWGPEIVVAVGAGATALAGTFTAIAPIQPCPVPLLP